MDVEDRAVGCVLGLALGDALGAPFEFRRASSIPSPPPAFELPWMGLPAGTTTDDTAMARNLIGSLVAKGGVLDTADVLARHGAWLASDPPDVGSLTRRVLSRASAGVADAAREYVDERGPEVSAGNGSVMYCAPLGVAYARRAGELAVAAPALSAITHWDERCRTACLAITATVASLLGGAEPRDAVVESVEGLGEREGAEELAELVDTAGRSRPIDGPDQGFVLFTAGVALRTLAEAPSFGDGLCGVVALGGDTDTNACVAGALLGTLHGRGRLPEMWLARLADRRSIESEAEALAGLVSR